MKALLNSGAKGVAKKAANTLAKIMPNTVAVPVEHLVGGQKWVIEEAIRLEESINLIDGIYNYNDDFNLMSM